MSLQHSVKYNHLPDWFIAFDIYDKDTNAFLSRQTFHDLLGSTSIATVPVLHQVEMLQGVVSVYSRQDMVVGSLSQFVLHCATLLLQTYRA
jgi:hypothetical protein